jgi:Mrp family chromosome partitioning ATPase/capsular polysaccharide biosynthesis protein
VEEYGSRSGRTLVRLWRRKGLIIFATVVAAIGALWFSLGQMDVYRATSRVVVRPVFPQAAFTSLGLGSAYGGPLGFEVSIETQAEVVRSGPVASAVGERLGLSVPPEVLAGSISVAALTNELLEIQSSAPNGRLAAALANGFADEYLDYRRRTAIRALEEIVTNLQSQATGLDSQIAETDAQIGDLLTGPGAGSPRARRAVLEQLQIERNELVVQQADLRERIEELTVAGQAAGIGGGDVLIRAVVPPSPSSPQPFRDAAVGGLLGFALGAGLALIRVHVDPRVETRDEAAEIAGAPVLAAVPIRRWSFRPLISTLKRLARRIQRREEDDHERPYGPRRLPALDPATADALSLVVATLTAQGLGSEIRRLLLISSGDREGTQETAAALAVVCAQRGLRTLLIGGNLRTPGMHPSLGVDTDPGLADLLDGQTSVRKSLVRVGPGGSLAVIPTGSPDGMSPAHLLASPRFPRVLEALAARRDIILIEGPPGSAESDVALLASVSDAALFIVRSGYAKPTELARTAAILDRSGLPIAGILLRDADRRDSSTGLPPGESARTELRRAEEDDDGELHGSGPRLVTRREG